MMKFSNKDRRGLAYAFKQAQKFLSETRYNSGGGVEYICCALDRAAAYGEISLVARDLAKRVIEYRLDKCGDLYSWLLIENYAAPSEMSYDSKRGSGMKMQRTRKAWLESLVAEFSRPA